jgi:hypothetical protein
MDCRDSSRAILSGQCDWLGCKLSLACFRQSDSYSQDYLVRRPCHLAPNPGDSSWCSQVKAGWIADTPHDQYWQANVAVFLAIALLDFTIAGTNTYCDLKYLRLPRMDIL